MTDDPRVLELYKLAVEMADRVSARRTAANAFFATLHGGLAAAVGILGQATSREVKASVYLLVAPIAGLALSAAWFLLLRSYRDLNKAKFNVITEIERELPLQIFAKEWEQLKKDPVEGWRGRYAEQGTVERVIPAVFSVLYAAAIVRVLFSL
ncbi:MAG: hypothetical protein H0V97_04135 [Actinobacteria bacterium]|nr:hypothetical protein [Actinomycetota bacterium]